MLDSIKLHLTYLLQAGYTHHDLKSIFSSYDLFDPIKLWNDTLLKKVDHSINRDRQEKIYIKSHTIEINKINNYLKTKDIDIVSLYDRGYPEKLKTIAHAPAFLYVRWDLRSNLPLVWVVWSRKHTPYAKKILDKILPDIIQAGIWIVSGGATGVDTIWHDIALKNSGYTIAVFGTGIDRCYPAWNKILFEDIITNGGAILSHFPLGTWPELYNFPIRNEIVAALSDGILIAEAGLSSGTLITAQLALEHGRDVFAIPWDVDRSTSEGTNMLISTGQAKMVRCAWDILEEYFDIESIGAGMTPVVNVRPILSNEEEKRIYEAIEKSINRVDDISRNTELSISDTLTTLAMLEINWHINMDEMGRYHVN